MFQKVFLVFSCLILYTASKSIQLRFLMNAVKTDKINCSNFIQPVDLTRIGNLHETIQETFCQISEALKKSNCTSSGMEKLQVLVDEVKGNVSCQLPESSKTITVEVFLDKLKNYLSSLPSYLKVHREN